MNKAVYWLDTVLKRSLITLMAAIVLVVCWQVLSRFVLQNPSSITEELARTLLLWIGMLGAALAYRTGQHLGLDIVTARLSPRWQRRVALTLTALVVLFAFAVMVVGGGALVQLTLQLKQMSAALGVPVGWLYSVIPVSGLLISFYGVCQLLCLWRGISLQQCSGCE